MTRPKKKEKEKANGTVKSVKPPEGFVSFNDFIAQNPKFCEKYEGNVEAHMAIWLDEPVDAQVLVSRKDDETGRVSVQSVVIPKHKSYPLKVWDFINWFGDPNLKLHLDIAPKDTFWDEKFWRSARNEKLAIFGRAISMRPRGDAPTFTSPTKTIAKDNTKYDLWDKYPKIYVLLPEKMVMTVGGVSQEVKVEDFVWEVMNTAGVDVGQDGFDEVDIKIIHDELYSRAKEFNLEGIFSSSAAGTIIEGYMITAKEKFYNK